MTFDPFRPRSEPARTIYDAFQAEAENRNGRPPEEWIEAERLAVLKAAQEAAPKYGLRAPTLKEVATAERYAMGSIDYGKTWAHQVVDAMRKPAL